MDNDATARGLPTAVGRLEFRTGTKGRMVASVTEHAGRGSRRRWWVVDVGGHGSGSIHSSFADATRVVFARLAGAGMIEQVPADTFPHPAPSGVGQ